MTLIPRESVPSLPRHEVSERPLLEGVSGRSSEGFEDFLFPLSDPSARAFFRSRPKPEPSPSTRRSESLENDPKSASKTGKPQEAQGGEPQASEHSAAVSETEGSRRNDLLDESLFQEEVATDPHWTVAAWPTGAIEPEAISQVVEDSSDRSTDGVSVVATPTFLLPIQAVAAEVVVPTESEVRVAAVSAAVANPLRVSTSAVTAPPQAVDTSSAVMTASPQVVEASSAAMAASPQVVDPDGEAAEEVSPDGRSPRFSREDSQSEPAASLFAESMSEIPLTETFVEESEPARVSAADVSPNLTRDSQAAPTATTPVSAMGTPNPQTQFAVPTPPPAPTPSMATPPSQWLQGGEYRRFLNRMDRAFELAGQRGGEIRLRLSPPRLGSIRLEMSMNQERMVARIETDSEETRQILLEQFPVLRERLAERGVAVESFQVEIRRDGDSASSDQRDDSRQRRLRRENELEVASASAGGTGPIICRLPMSGNHLTGLDVIV